jgi:phosphoglycerate dehydrogenase-like enzyme
MAHRIAILDDYQGIALDCADWKSLPADVAIETFTEHLGGEAAVAAALAGFDVVVAMRERTPFPASLLERLPDLRLLVTTGMRNLAIDMEAARGQGVTVCGTAMLGHSAAEHAWALILALTKRIPLEDRTMHAGGWQASLVDGLKGNTLGIVGLGRLGAQVAQVGTAFGMRVVAWSANLTAERAAECGAELVDKETLFRDSDIITVHMVLSERSRGLVGTPEFALMKPTVFLVNTSRGPIVDEAALIEALMGETIAGAGIDVFDVEPLPKDHPLRGFDNAVLTGHTGYVMRENYLTAYGDTVENIAAWIAGDPVRVLNGD